MGWHENQFVAAVLRSQRLGAQEATRPLRARSGRGCHPARCGGLFSVAGYAIAHRTGAFAIRMALDATRRAVVRAALHSTTVAVAPGLTAGMAFSPPRCSSDGRSATSTIRSSSRESSPCCWQRRCGSDRSRAPDLV